VGAVISYEEYYPYGSTSFQVGRSSTEVSLKRYRYTGKERDEETGLYYHGARYYIPWLARWSAVDPLQGAMPEWSPYNYGYCNPITWTDPTGMQPGSGDDPNWHAPMSAPEGGFSNGKGSPWNPIELPEVTVTAQAPNNAAQNQNDYQARSSTRTFGFVLRNPAIATRIGEVESGSLNISTVSTRFAASIGLKDYVIGTSPEQRSTEGTEVNAFRHVLWQASISSEFGASVAVQVGNAHEINPLALQDIGDPASAVFNNLASADEAIDLLNNIIGREIGIANPDANQKELAQETLDAFKEKGLWVAIKLDDNQYKIGQVKLSDTEYSKAKEDLQSRNQYGFTQSQWNARQNAAEKRVEQEKGRLFLGPKF
jgi:RHS repeat-associated protein